VRPQAAAFGLLVSVYDAAMRGVHISALPRAGIVTVSPVAAENPTAKAIANRA